MNHQKIGYARVSTTDQNLERQLDMLRQQGAEIIFQEKMTGTKRDRPELNRLLSTWHRGIPSLWNPCPGWAEALRI